MAQSRFAPPPSLAAYASAGPGRTDAHACRIACARPYYFCIAGDNGGVCSSAWSQCVAACDAPILSEGAVEPVTGAAPQPAAR